MKKILVLQKSDHYDGSGVIKVGIHSTLVAHAALCVGPCMMDVGRKNEEQHFFLNLNRALRAPPT